MGRNRKSNRGSITPATLETALMQKSALQQMQTFRDDATQEEIKQAVYTAYDALKQTISRLSPADQQALFVQASARRTDAALNKNERFSDDATMIALGLYGNPALRWEALKNIRDYPIPLHVILTKNESVPILSGSDFNRLSFDKLLYEALRNVGIDVDDVRNIDVTNPTAIQDQFGEEMFDIVTSQFMQYFSDKHSGSNNNLCGAAMQTAVAQIGENKGVRNPPSFYPKGTIAPEPAPLILALLQRQYERTQAQITQARIPLYRGTKKLDIGIAMSPWSVSSEIARKHAGKTGTLYFADIPKQHIFMMHTDPNWASTFPLEKEFLILESGMNKRVTRRKQTPLAGYANGVVLEIGG